MRKINSGELNGPAEMMKAIDSINNLIEVGLITRREAGYKKNKSQKLAEDEIEAWGERSHSIMQSKYNDVYRRCFDIGWK